MLLGKRGGELHSPQEEPVMSHSQPLPTFQTAQELPMLRGPGALSDPASTGGSWCLKHQAADGARADTMAAVNQRSGCRPLPRHHLSCICVELSSWACRGTVSSGCGWRWIHTTTSNTPRLTPFQLYAFTGQEPSLLSNVETTTTQANSSANQRGRN